MENRAFSPIVLAGGILAAGLMGFVAARQIGDTTSATAPAVAGTTAPADAAGSPVPANEFTPLDATEGEIEPGETLTATSQTPAPSRPPAPGAAPAREASVPRPAPAATTSARPANDRVATPPAARPTPSPNRGPAVEAARPQVEAARPQAEAARVVRHEPTWSRPFPSPEATRSLPTQTAPRIDAPPPPPLTRSLTVPADAVVGLQIERAVSSETAAVEDTVSARVTRDVLAEGVVVIPAGSRVNGSVTLVDEGGKVRDRARLGVRFHTLVLADGTEMQLPTATIYRDGESPSGRSAARIGGGATAGALIGAILGGGKGAAIGAAVGAGGGTAATMRGARKPATLPAGQTVTVRLSDPVTLEVPR